MTQTLEHAHTCPNMLVYVGRGHGPRVSSHDARVSGHEARVSGHGPRGCHMPHVSHEQFTKRDISLKMV